jgi:preprotein translocase subunit SecE
MRQLTGKMRTIEMVESKKTSPIEFIKQVKTEAKKVTWPTRQETTISTIMVFIMVTIVAIFLFLVDQSVAAIIQWILG